MGSICPEHYYLHLEPNFTDFSFIGTVIIKIKVDNPITEVILNALEIEIKECQVRFEDDYVDINHSIFLEKQELKLELPENSAKSFDIKIKYVGEINDKLVGFYRSKYQVNDEERYAGVTQFQESDARRAFPCFDEPKMKATFDIELLVDRDLVTISNTPILEENELENGQKLVKFERTPIMSAYLLFFGVGDFEFIEDKIGDTLIRVAAHPPKATQFGQFALDFGKKSLQFCEEYFDIPYPLPKLDLIGTPAFAAGAMENWGGILFRENLLLHYPGITSKAQETTIQEVIAHEIAHMWFGNLVSPSAWKYLWLNESFATYFGYGVIDHYYPEKKIWEIFVRRETEVALMRDAYLVTIPIELPGEGEMKMSVKSTPILYNKGGSVLRMLENYLGKDDFREGLRYYLKKYAYDVAESNDLWEALEESSGKPINNLMKSWVLQKGYPVIMVDRDDRKVTFTQKKFSYLSNNSDQTWIVPISIKSYSDNETKISYELLDGRSKTIDLESTPFVINTNLTGFYRVYYPTDYYQILGKFIESKTISHVDRWIIINDRYAFVRSGILSLDEYMDYIQFYANEDNHLSISSISDHLNSFYLLFDESLKPKIAQVGKTFLENVLERIGLEQKDNEDPNISRIRGNLVNGACFFSSDIAKTFALEKFSQLKEGKKISPDLMNSILQIAARETNDFEWFIDKFENAESEQEKINYIGSLGKFSDKALIEKIQFYIFDKIPSRNRINAIASLATNPVAIPSLWHWFLANLDNFEKLHPYMLQGALTAIIPRCVDFEADIKSFFEEYVKKNPIVTDALDIALELMEINAKIKNRHLSTTTP